MILLYFSLESRPALSDPMVKTSTIRVYKCKEPFKVETQEGVEIVSPETVDDWDDGYYVAYPSDGSKPYSISPKFLLENYRIE